MKHIPGVACVVVTGFDPVEFAVGGNLPRIVKAGGEHRSTKLFSGVHS